MSGATGYIDIIRTCDGFQYQWVGGDTIWIHGDFLRLIDDGIISNRTPSTGEEFSIGPFRLRCTAHLIRPQVIEAVRIDDS